MPIIHKDEFVEGVVIIRSPSMIYLIAELKEPIVAVVAVVAVLD